MGPQEGPDQDLMRLTTQLSNGTIRHPSALALSSELVRAHTCREVSKSGTIQIGNSVSTCFVCSNQNERKAASYPLSSTKIAQGVSLCAESQNESVSVKLGLY